MVTSQHLRRRRIGKHGPLDRYEEGVADPRQAVHSVMVHIDKYMLRLAAGAEVLVTPLGSDNSVKVSAPRPCRRAPVAFGMLRRLVAAVHARARRRGRVHAAKEGWRRTSRAGGVDRLLF
jgi:hypothetical protein